MNDKFLNMLGLARRAGKLSLGHDASFESIQKGKAYACFLCCDASDRLKEEFDRTTKFEGRNIPLILTEYSKGDLHAATSKEAAVFTINDEGFANTLIKLLGGTD